MNSTTAMRPLNSLQSIVFALGGLLMVAGVALPFFGQAMIGAWMFLIGAICFGVMQMMQCYEGNSATIRRLRRIMMLADVLFILAGVLMVEQQCHFALPLFEKNGITGLNVYTQYIVHNNWVLVLFLAAVFELYSMHRISHELARDEKKS